MTVTRKAMRDALRAAAAADPRLGAYVPCDWGDDLGERDRVGICWGTPREDKRREAAGEFHRQTQIMALVKRRGRSELEDELDDDADAIEALALPILDGLGVADAQVTTIETEIIGRGEKRHGTAMVTITVVQLP